MTKAKDTFEAILVYAALLGYGGVAEAFDILLDSVIFIAVVYAFFWILFKIHYSKYRRLAQVLKYPFVVSDFLANMGPVTLIWGEIPREALVTGRLKRWQRYPPDVKHVFAFRRWFSFWMGDKLDESDPGHMK